MLSGKCCSHIREVYKLKGGIQHYGNTVGAEGWKVGRTHSCFVGFAGPDIASGDFLMFSRSFRFFYINGFLSKS